MLENTIGVGERNIDVSVGIVSLCPSLLTYFQMRQIIFWCVQDIVTNAQRCIDELGISIANGQIWLEPRTDCHI